MQNGSFQVLWTNPDTSSLILDFENVNRKFDNELTELKGKNNKFS